MKKLMPRAASLVRPLLTIGVGFVLALFSAALTYYVPPTIDESFGGATFFLQSTSTSTPQPDGISEIGSTDGIVIMGFLIVLIIIIPILWHRKAWMEPR